MRWHLFYTERMQLKGQSNKKLKSVKNLVFHRQPEDVQLGLRVSRKEEWINWQNFKSGYPIDSKQLKALTGEGYRVIPTQWIEIDKNEHMRRPGGPKVAPKYKSRLVVRGDL